MMHDLVSIITPMYNARRYIAGTIESVTQQTYQNWEMIIMDDLSDDGSAEIVKSFAEKDTRIKYFCESKKAGVAKARNDAMLQAKGRYIAFLDSDDLWKPDKLERQLNLLKEKKCAFVYGGCDVINENGEPQNIVRRVPIHVTYKKLLWGNVIPCLTVCIDREKTGDFQMPAMGHEDYATWLTILKITKEAYGIDEVLGSYRVNRNSVSGKKLRTIRWTWNIYRKNQKLPIYKSFMYLMGHLMQAMRKMR